MFVLTPRQSNPFIWYIAYIDKYAVISLDSMKKPIPSP